MAELARCLHRAPPVAFEGRQTALLPPLPLGDSAAGAEQGAESAESQPAAPSVARVTGESR